VNNQSINIRSNVFQRFMMRIVPEPKTIIIHIYWNVSQSVRRMTWNVLYECENMLIKRNVGGTSLR
jgi:hypothetical protein